YIPHQQTPAWRAFAPALGDPLAALRDLVNAGGKRLRPAFCHWAFVGAGGDPADPLGVDAGAPLELPHGFALVSDAAFVLRHRSPPHTGEVVEGANRRRGAEPAHRSFEARHGRGHWRGEG